MRKATRACVTVVCLSFAGCAAPADEARESAALARAGETTLIAAAGRWDFNANYTPIDPAWNQPGFGGSWGPADAPMGYGEPYLATVFSMPPSGAAPTTYFRRTFYVDDPAAVGALRGEVMYDDGVVVYLNGARIDALGMPAGAVTQSTLALGHEANGFESRDWTAARAHLRTGANVIAVELHQQTRSSSDAVFDLALYATLQTSTPPGEDIPRRATWAYFDRGVDLGTLWRGNAYDDSAWARGAGVFGYGESYIATTVSYGADAGRKHPTTYFRNRFRVADADAVTSMIAEVIYDDGAVIYVNGTEVKRLSMPTGTITYATLAPGHETGPTYVTVDLGAARSLLVDGDNVIAVEVHQASASSSDLAFDLALTLETSGPPPPPAVDGIARGAVWKATTGSAEPGTCCLDWPRGEEYFDDSNWLQLRAPIGYGESYVRSMITYGPDPANKYNAYYFRNAFVVEDPREVTALFADVMYDDGITIYLNGQEVARRSMPSGFTDHDTHAIWHEANNSYETIDLAAAIQLLQPGRNIVAARVNQDTPSSSDLVFDLSIRFTANPPAPTVSRRNAWLYYDHGPAPAGWQTSSDDTGWDGGYAPLGYEQRVVRTWIGYEESGATRRPQTTYFRRHFTVDDPAAVTQLFFETLYDDGAVVYLNGVEVHRFNMPAGTITHDTPALAPYPVEGQYEGAYLNPAIGLLRAGVNVLAVEVHQASPSGDDLVFDAALEVMTAATPRFAGCDPRTPPPDLRLDGVWIAPSGTVWAAGDTMVMRRDPAGTYAWCRPDGRDLHAVWGSAEDDVWIVGDGIVMRWDGVDFQGVNVPDGSHYFDVWGSGPDDVFLVGDEGRADHFDGDSIDQNVLEARDVRAVWGTGANDVWAVGRFTYQGWSGQMPLSSCESRVWRWNPAGRTWALEHAFLQDHGGCGFDGVGGTGPDDLWAVGHDYPAGAAAGFAMAARSDGTTWSKFNPPDEELMVDRNYTDVAAGAPGGTWITASGRTAVRFDGTTWHDGGELTGDLEAIDVRGSAMYAVGGGGKVLRWNGSAWVRDR